MKLTKRNLLLPDGTVRQVEVREPEGPKKVEPAPLPQCLTERTSTSWPKPKHDYDGGGLFGSSPSSSMLRLAIFGII